MHWHDMFTIQSRYCSVNIEMSPWCWVWTAQEMSYTTCKTRLLWQHSSVSIGRSPAAAAIVRSQMNIHRSLLILQLIHWSHITSANTNHIRRATDDNLQSQHMFVFYSLLLTARWNLKGNNRERTVENTYYRALFESLVSMTCSIWCDIWTHWIFTAMKAFIPEWTSQEQQQKNLEIAFEIRTA